MERDGLIAFIKSHKGKIIGISIGLFFGILVLTVGFWRSLFLALCVAVGFGVGSLYDKDSKFRVFLERILPTGIK
ncbi:MAG: DUF2273 domain-containing protein [Clostridiales bacterium]|nr:DUF2273 domain-containing protein [Clostridiales bacterium]